VSLIAVLAARAGGWRQVNPLYLTESGISVDEPAKYLVYYAVVALFVGLALLAGRRAGCHTICWMAPFMILGRAIRNRAGWPALRLQTEPAACRACRKCATNCPMSLNVTAMVQAGRLEHAECILCGTCVDNCPHGAIRFTFSAGR
jgi:polyferredoxin